MSCPPRLQSHPYVCTPHRADFLPPRCAAATLRSLTKKGSLRDFVFQASTPGTGNTLFLTHSLTHSSLSSSTHTHTRTHTHSLLSSSTHSHPHHIISTLTNECMNEWINKQPSNSCTLMLCVESNFVCFVVGPFAYFSFRSSPFPFPLTSKKVKFLHFERHILST